MNKSQLAKKRNWAKFQLLGGFRLDTTVLTQEEQELYTTIQTCAHTLVENWDKNSRLLNLKVERYDLTICNQDGSDKEVIKNLTLKQARAWGKAAKEDGLLASYVKV